MNNEGYKTIISSEHKILDLHIRETLQYRDLIFLFVKRDFTAKYKQTVLGPMWAIIQPLLTTVVFTVVFGALAQLTTSDIEGEYYVPGFLFYLIGNICWNYFSTTLNATSTTFISNSATMGKVYYPRLVAPIATALSNLISFFIQFVMLIAIWIVIYLGGESSISFSPMLFLLPLCILQMMLLSVGLGIIISSATTKYRDLAMVVAFGLQLWQYASPIAYGLQLVPNRYQWIYMMNPFVSIITTFRYSVLGFGYFNPVYYGISWGVSVVLFIIGLIFFSKIERTFMDTV